ncbi:kinase-like domain-containing protein [Panaeolus papilionaceus]|nr:kinase-like domain-containing protein [Panaeolus papilionaceus]
MHGVGLVHRDIKLENILLTTPLFSSLVPTSEPPSIWSLPPPTSPLIKLSDFGLSRFVQLYPNGTSELLTTRCGSEAYAAPELVLGGLGVSYDARYTDAWACGVVLYGLVGRQLPFGEGVGVDEAFGNGHPGRGHSKIGGERGAVGVGGVGKMERKQWLMKIALGDWRWPGEDDDNNADDEKEGATKQEEEEEGEMLVGPTLVKSKGEIRKKRLKRRKKRSWKKRRKKNRKGCYLIRRASIVSRGERLFERLISLRREEGRLIMGGRRCFF